MKTIFLLFISLWLTMILQAQVQKTVTLTSGTLSSSLTEEEKNTITSLTLIGTVDAREFKLIRDKMPFLEVLDLRSVNIKAYSGTEGTSENITDYKGNEVPPKAFDNTYFERKSRLTTVVLPESVTVIGEEAFSQCRAMKSFEIPLSVTAIHYYAFAGTGIRSIIIPSSVTAIGMQVFRGCKSLKRIELPSSITEIGNAAFEGCDSLTSVILPALLTSISHRLFYSCSGLKIADIGPAVTAIEDEAFFYCTSLDSIKIPASVTRIGYNAFTFCYSLKKVYAYPVNPPDLSNAGVVFSNVDFDKCILYVPAGTKSLYASAYQWKDFTHIVEMGTFSMEVTQVTFEKESGQVMLMLHSSLPWTAASNQQWLTVNPLSGIEGQQLTLRAEANPLDKARTAMVTIHAEGMEPLTITVIQHGLITAVDAAARPVAITCYPTPFTSQMVIEVENPLLKEITVEIYSITGQRIKTLVRAQKGREISLVWKGEDEQGKKVPAGIYLLKMNEMTRKVVRK